MFRVIRTKKTTTPSAFALKIRVHDWWCQKSKASINSLELFSYSKCLEWVKGVVCLMWNAIEGQNNKKTRRRLEMGAIKWCVNISSYKRKLFQLPFQLKMFIKIVLATESLGALKCATKTGYCRGMIKKTSLFCYIKF